MATIYKTPTGYRIQFMFKGKRYSGRFPTKKQCIDWHTDKLLELSNQTNIDAPPINNKSFREVLVRYRDTVTPKKLNHKNEAHRIDAFIQVFSQIGIVDLPIDCINKQHMNDWCELRLTQVSTSSVAREWNILSNIFTTAIYQWELITISPFKGLKKPKERPPRDRLIQPHEIEGILKVLKYAPDVEINTLNKRVGAAFIFALETGLRAKELCLLQWEDVNGRVIHITSSKTRSGIRQVPLSMEARKIIDHLAEYKISVYVFGLKTSQLDSLFRKARNTARLSGFTFHDSRANALTHLAKKIDILDLARIIGHKDLKTLMTYYREAVEDIALRLD